jgi:hypothetical protein
MAWNAPITWTPNQTLTAALLNTQLRDNMLQTMPGLASGPNEYLMCTASGTVATREIACANVTTLETRTSTTFGDLTTAGPSVTLTTGDSAIVIISAQHSINVDYAEIISSHAVSGATTIAASDNYSITTNETLSNSVHACNVMLWGTGDLTPGTNTFTMKYRVGTAGNIGSFSKREIIVIPG